MREHTDGDFPFANDFNAIVQALADEAAVVSGCSVSDGGTNDRSVSVASGTVRIDGSKYSVDSQSVTLSSSDPDSDRYDLIVVGTDGVVESVTGVASSTPKAPSIPANHVLLAIVCIEANTLGIVDADIFGTRVVHSLTQVFYDHSATEDAHHARYTDAEVRSAINTDADHGSTASHEYRTDSEIQTAATAYDMVSLI